MAVDVYNIDPWMFFAAIDSNVHFGIVFPTNPRETSGKTDGCDAGCWRTFGHVRTIRSRDGKLVGFKRLLKFIPKNKALPLVRFAEGYQERTWVMQEHRFAKNRYKYKAICRIQLLLAGPVHDLLYNHIRGINSIVYNLESEFSSFEREMIIGRDDYDDISEEIVMLMTLKTCINEGHFFPQGKYLYCVYPCEGDLLFASKTQFCTKTDGSHVGCWRTILRDTIVKSETGKTLGFKKLLKFCPVHVPHPPHISYLLRKHGRRLIWVMEEYRLAKKSKQHKVVCKIQLIEAFQLDNWLRYR